MIYVELEKIWKRFKNKYKFLVFASVEARKLIEEIGEGSPGGGKNIYQLALERALQQEIKEENNEK